MIQTVFSQVFIDRRKTPGSVRKKRLMIINLSSGRKIDTEKELTAEERHIVQKLYAWASVAQSSAVFKTKKEHAFKTGWNNSGPVAERNIVRQIIADLEKTFDK